MWGKNTHGIWKFEKKFNLSSDLPDLYFAALSPNEHYIISFSTDGQFCLLSRETDGKWYKYTGGQIRSTPGDSITFDENSSELLSFSDGSTLYSFTKTSPTGWTLSTCDGTCKEIFSGINRYKGGTYFNAEYSKCFAAFINNEHSYLFTKYNPKKWTYTTFIHNNNIQTARFNAKSTRVVVTRGIPCIRVTSQYDSLGKTKIVTKIALLEFLSKNTSADFYKRKEQRREPIDRQPDNLFVTNEISYSSFHSDYNPDSSFSCYERYYLRNALKDKPHLLATFSSFDKKTQEKLVWRYRLRTPGPLDTLVSLCKHWYKNRNDQGIPLSDSEFDHHNDDALPIHPSNNVL